MTRHPNPPPIPSILQNPPNRGVKRGIIPAGQKIPNQEQLPNQLNQNKKYSSTKSKSNNCNSSVSSNDLTNHEEGVQPKKLNKHIGASSQLNTTEEDLK